MWQGFVTLGRTELMLTFLAVSLLMIVLGYAAGQIVLMIRRPVVAPEPCTRLHCEIEAELNTWLNRCQYSLITNEVLSTLDLSKPDGRHTAPSPLQHWQDEQSDLAEYGPRPLWWERGSNGKLTPFQYSAPRRMPKPPHQDIDLEQYWPKDEPK